jgi:ubiquinone biosynthesis monooxygenase Coq7
VAIPDTVAPEPAALPSVNSLPAWLRAELRSDHAGETGAVYIYLGILAVSRHAGIRGFAGEHLKKEREHLAFFEQWLERRDISLLIPLWRLSGWLLGACSGLAGPRAVYITIDAVEDFVVAHYGAQVARLREADGYREIRDVLEQFQHDEEHHRQDAASRYNPVRPSLWARAWRSIVDSGSRLAVSAARRL